MLAGIAIPPQHLRPKVASTGTRYLVFNPKELASGGQRRSIELPLLNDRLTDGQQAAQVSHDAHNAVFLLPDGRGQPAFGLAAMKARLSMAQLAGAPYPAVVLALLHLSRHILA